jgi:signal transduction histidine kinase/CheY-like chemotaxis protein
MFVLAVVIVQRITASAAELHRLQADLEHESRRRADALARSEAALAQAERLAVLGRISASVAHEVNNPTAVLSANLSYLGFALREDPRPQLRSCLEDSEAAVARIAAIVKQLLVAGRSARNPDAPVAPVSLARSVDAAVAAATARGAAQVSFERDVPPGLYALAHADPLVQVLSNLVVNAVQAIPASRRGRVAVRASAEGPNVGLVVEDDGDGMSSDTLQRLFEPFYSTKPAGAGTGLGLAVSRALVEAMHGTLRFESAAGAGTRAIVTLPRTEVAPALTPPPAIIPAAPAHKRPLLLVDDEDHVRSSLARLLGLRWDVTVADGVSAALDEALSRPYDVVLCDVVMPAGGGERFWEEISRFAPEVGRRVVFMTGGAPTVATRDFLATQPQPVLQKPIDLAAIDAAVAGVGGPAKSG